MIGAIIDAVAAWFGGSTWYRRRFAGRSFGWSARADQTVILDSAQEQAMLRAREVLERLELADGPTVDPDGAVMTARTVRQGWKTEGLLITISFAACG